MLKQIAKSIDWPDWAHEDSRFRRLALNDLALTGRLYDRLRFPFSAEVDTNRQPLSMWQKRPSMRLNIPIMASHILSRKLFGTKHAPHVVHKKPKIVEALKGLIDKAQLDLKMLDTAFWGQSGSVVATCMMVDGVPNAKVWQGKDCWKVCDEAGNMTELIIAYCVDGSTWLADGVMVDQDGAEIKAGESYWYIKVLDQVMIGVIVPPKYDKWNPETGSDYRNMTVVVSKTKPHGFDFIPAHWIKNLPGQDDPNCMDGASLFGPALDNCISMDYNLSQSMRGLNATAAPQLMIKGKVVGYQEGRPHVLGPANTLNLPADRKEASGISIGGADAKLIEMNGKGIETALTFDEKMHQFTLETISVSRKNPDTVQGAMSGKAMELIDSEFIDLVEVGQVRYGKYGYLKIIIIIASMMILAKIGDFAGIDIKELDEVKLEWPKIYTASPQEAQFLITAVIAAVQANLMDFDEGYVWLMAQLGKSSEQFDAVVDPEAPKRKIMLPGEMNSDPNQPKPVATAKK